MSKTFQMLLHSPRWGHADTYRFDFGQDGITVDNGTGKLAQYSPERGWQGHNGDHALLNILSDDHIYAPRVIETGVECIWDLWQSGHISEDSSSEMFKDIETWINTCTSAMPHGERWSGVW